MFTSMLTMAIEEGFGANRPIDDRIILAIADGDSDAFAELYERTKGSVYGLALSITKNTHDAEEVLQDTYLTVWNRAGNYEPHSKPMAWIFTIARNAALMRLRTYSRQSDVAQHQFEARAAVSELENTEQRLTLQAAFTVLDDDERMILLAHAAWGLRFAESARLLSLPLGTVLSRYHRTVKKLKRELEKGDEVSE